jgi:tetratricopeptide (TPR) repeat protein
MVIVPALFLGTLEIALRLGGYGYPTQFFLPSRVGGVEYLVPNERFTYRFFPKAIARPTLSIRIKEKKEPGTYRIFVFGESAALGDPDANYGFSPYLEKLLGARYPGARFEVICLGMTAISSHVILPIARECAELDGDLWILYMGNNEMVGPFGAGTIFGAKAPPRIFVKASIALQTTRTGQFLANLKASLSRSAGPAKWSGIAMFRKNELRRDDPARLRAYENFEANLKEIIQVGRRAGVPVLVSTVGSSLRDCSPFASMHRVAFDETSLETWRNLYRQGWAGEMNKDYALALGKYREAEALDAEPAELQFRIGICETFLGRADAAKMAFVRARDFDGLGVRADSNINRILWETSRTSGANVVGVDAAELLGKQSPGGIPGRSLFFEHVHFSFEGNYQLAKLMGEEVAKFLPAPITGSATVDWLDSATAHRSLALTPWDQKRIWLEIGQRLSGAPFKDQSSQPGNLDYIRERLRELDAVNEGERVMESRRQYEAALATMPENTLLIGNYAQFLGATGSTSEAILQAKKFHDFLPDLAWANYYYGAVLARVGRQAEAVELLERALELRPELVHAQEALTAIRQK